jgi:predicted DNA-binding transcriptional regulator AlpA
MMDIENETLLRMQGVADMLGISRHTLRRLIKKDPTFPRFIELTPGIRMVRARNIRAWLRKKEVESLKNM